MHEGNANYQSDCDNGIDNFNARGPEHSEHVMIPEELTLRSRMSMDNHPKYMMRHMGSDFQSSAQTPNLMQSVQDFYKGNAQHHYGYVFPSGGPNSHLNTPNLLDSRGAVMGQHIGFPAQLRQSYPNNPELQSF